MPSLFDPPPDDSASPIFPEGEVDRLRMMLSLRRSRQFLVGIPIVLVMLPLVTLQDEGTLLVMGIPHAVWRIALVALMIALLAFTFWNYRCPACDAFLGRRSALSRTGCEICRGYP